MKDREQFEPSDADFAWMFAEANETLKKYLDMPKQTISDVLVQGAEVVNAIGAMAIAVIARDWAPLPKGQVYEVEIETRASIDTFKTACNNVIAQFEELLKEVESER